MAYWPKDASHVLWVWSDVALSPRHFSALSFFNLLDWIFFNLLIVMIDIRGWFPMSTKN